MSENKQKTIVINGATGGIGRAIAQKLAKQGYALTLVGRDADKLTSVKQELHALGNNNISTFAFSHVGKEAIFAVAQKILQEREGVYAYINSAGYVKQCGVLEVSDKDWEDLFKISLMSNIWFISALAENMMKNNEGRIILVNGVFSVEPSPDVIINSTLTGAVRNFAKALSKDFGRHKITVNTINPSATDTILWKNIVTTLASKLGISEEEMHEKSTAGIPLNRIATPEDVANCAAYLCSKEAAFINGVGLILDGGMTASC